MNIGGLGAELGYVEDKQLRRKQDMSSLYPEDSTNVPLPPKTPEMRKTLPGRTRYALLMSSNTRQLPGVSQSEPGVRFCGGLSDLRDRVELVGGTSTITVSSFKVFHTPSYVSSL